MTQDRLVIGDHAIPFSELSVWREEMGNVATKIAQYAPEHLSHVKKGGEASSVGSEVIHGRFPFAKLSIDDLE